LQSGWARTAQSGERLLVTVLFCDLRGFTPTAARLAPADVRLLETYYEYLSQIVFAHGGTVLRWPCPTSTPSWPSSGCRASESLGRTAFCLRRAVLVMLGWYWWLHG